MKKILAVLALVALAACSNVMSGNVEYAIDSSAYTALTAEKLVLGRPCTATVTKVCVTPDLAKTLRDARLMLMQALVNYQTARDAYLVNVSAGGNADDAAVAAAYASLQNAITNANAVLSLDTVKAILAAIGS